MDETLTTMRVIFTGSGVSSSFWLYWLTTFMDLLLTLLSGSVFYTTLKRYLSNYKALGGANTPVNVSRVMFMCLTLLIFLRVSMDTVILLTWQEISSKSMFFWQQMNELFDTLAIVPFLVFFYLAIRAGPTIEFQLLRQPIPTDLHPSWKMIRGPVFAFILMVILSLLVVSSKLLG
jgi:hypothetical protein